MLKPIGYMLALLALAAPSLAAARTVYESPELLCTPSYSQVSLGNAGRFTAVSNTDGPFMWVAGDLGFVDAGPVFVTPMTELGWQDVIVVWGSKRAYCRVEVVGYPGYGESWSYLPYGSYDPGLNVTLTSVKLSGLPYTGYDIPLAPLALSAILLAAYAALLYPHARKIITAVAR